MNISEQLRGLQLFVEKSEKLERSGFTQFILNNDSGVHMSWHRDYGEQSFRWGPSEESIEAFVLTLRFFIQDNEPSSLRKMTGHFEQLLKLGLITENTKVQWDAARAAINGYLDTPTAYSESVEKHGAVIREDRYTYRQIMEVFVYGGLAHSNEQYSTTFKQWQANGLMFPLLEHFFIDTIGQLVLTFAEVRKLVSIALSEVEARLAALNA
jgi:hypothetical protein